VADNSRIEDLRRRILRDPASIAFAQLAEEYRRAGDCEEAVRVCEAGLAQHPAYLSARVTLGRALFQLGRLEEARAEFVRVLDAAPDNLTAVGKLAEIHQRTHQAAHLRAAAESAQRAPEATPGGTPDGRSIDERIVAELTAWLDVITQERLARR
jgi:tetratricopeptide (TPR) repeat protein